MNKEIGFSERDANIFMLDTFPMDVHNVLDSPIDDLIKATKAKIKDTNRRLGVLDKKDKKESEKYRKLNKPRSYDNEIQVEIFGLIEESRYMEEELTALFEIKIIYAFKHLEINIKLLLSAAYPEEFDSKTYKWETLIQFLSSKGIKAKSIKEYSEINQLRTVNNALKHSGNIIDNSTTGIEEFKGKTFYYYENLEKFYSRVKTLPHKFLISLKNEILKEVFEFPESRLKQMANTFSSRMSKQQAIRFSKELLNLY